MLMNTSDKSGNVSPSVVAWSTVWAFVSLSWIHQKRRDINANAETGLIRFLWEDQNYEQGEKKRNHRINLE